MNKKNNMEDICQILLCNRIQYSLQAPIFVIGEKNIHIPITIKTMGKFMNLLKNWTKKLWK